MPAAQSKELAQKEEEEEVPASGEEAEHRKKKSEQRRSIQLLLQHISMNLITLTLPIQAGPKVSAELYQGDFAKGAKFMGLCSAATAAFEFLFNPTAGCWSDDHGRKRMLLLGPVAGVLTSAMYCLAPRDSNSVWWAVLLARAVGNGCNAMSGSAMTVAGFTDACRGDQALLTASLARFTSYVGIGGIIGTGTGGLILARTAHWAPGWAGQVGGSDRAVYAVRGVWSLLHALWILRFMPEPLPPEKRRPFNNRLVNPFTFLDLFRTTRMLTRLTVFNMFEILTEGKSVNDVIQLWLQADLGFSVSQAATFTVGAGATYLTCGNIVNYLVPRLGPRGFTSFAKVGGALSYLLTGGIRRGWASYLGLLLRLPAVNGAGGVVIKSLATKHAINAGMGAGEYAGKFANLRALVYVVGPPFLTRIYAYMAQGGGNTGWSFAAITLLGCIIPGLMHQTWKTEDMYPWAKGKEAVAAATRGSWF